MNIERAARSAQLPVQAVPVAINAVKAAEGTGLPSAYLRLALALALPREPASVGKVRRLADAALSALGVAASCRADVALMLAEACTNAVVHAAGATFRVNLTVDRGRCVLEVFDDGLGLPDRPIGRGTADGSAETGRGMALIRALSDAAEWVQVRPRGLAVRMSKRLSWDTGGLAGRDRVA
ncbi:ATP-binding protein [Dactylosporangium vinaceum]|uniref:ATP-binding protein n=1 Tax=Dactylosporangium vinaceum TaxID=53362 RepID=A0ABV5MSQ0_9ACTN|nr:ATP-binding protein [Dactylosporangium vinaceum]UAC00145.1 ATP-binding protein [Dactylosporangium vinaceum]